MTRLNIKRYKHIFTVSEFSKKEIMEEYHIKEDKISVTYNAATHIKSTVPDETILEELQIKDKTFCFALGSKSSHKNHKFIEQCAKNNPDITFVISGGINSRVLKDDNMEELNNMIYTGYVSDNKIVALYKSCACFIYPSLYEGFGIPPLEAITAGCKKVLLSNIDVFKEVYGDSVEYFDLKNAETFNFKEMLDNGKQVKEDIIEKYSWKNIAKQILEKVEENE